MHGAPLCSLCRPTPPLPIGRYVYTHSRSPAVYCGRIGAGGEIRSGQRPSARPRVGRATRCHNTCQSPAASGARLRGTRQDHSFSLGCATKSRQQRQGNEWAQTREARTSVQITCAHDTLLSVLRLHRRPNLFFGGAHSALSCNRPEGPSSCSRPTSIGQACWVVPTVSTTFVYIVPFRRD